MPLYEVVLEQRYYNQQVINRWNYLGTGTPAAVTGSFALLSALGMIGLTTTLTSGTLGAAIQGFQNNSVAFIQATCRAVYIDDDFYGAPFANNTVGVAAGIGDALSPVSAFGFRSNRVKQSIGRGYKRFVGMSEGDVENGGLLNSSAIFRADVARVAMNGSVTYDDEGNTLSFSPCIAQKELYVTPASNNAYKYYATELEQATHLAVGINWELYSQMRTQNTRQYGRGS